MEILALAISIQIVFLLVGAAHSATMRTAPIAPPEISSFYRANVTVYLFETSAEAAATAAADEVIGLSVSARTGAATPFTLRQLVFASAHSVVLNAQSFLSVADQGGRVALFRRDECGLVAHDSSMCFFFQDCPRVLPSIFPSLRFAEPLGTLDRLPHALLSHFSEIGIDVRVHHAHRRRTAAAAAEAAVVVVAAETAASMNSTTASGASGAAFEHVSPALSPRHAAPVSLASQPAIDAYMPSQISVFALHFEAGDVNVFVADGRVLRLVIGAGLVSASGRKQQRPASARELIVDIDDAAAVHVGAADLEDAKKMKRVTSSLKMHVDLDELATRVRCKEVGPIAVKPNPVHGNLSGPQPQSIPVTGRRRAATGDLDERAEAETYTIELMFRFWPETGLLPLWDEAIYREAAPTLSPSASSSSAAARAPKSAAAVGAPPRATNDGTIVRLVKWAFGLE